MQESNLYGQLPSEKMAEDSKVAHEIVREVNNFGISDRQRWLIINYLAMELENISEMQALTGYISEVKGDNLFISKLYCAEEKGKNNG